MATDVREASRGQTARGDCAVHPPIAELGAGVQHLGMIRGLRDRLSKLGSDVTRGGIAGMPSTFSRVAGWVLRFRAHRRWLRTIQGPTTRSIVEVYPRIIYRPSGTYLYSGTTWRQRLAMLEAHYAFLNRTYSAAFFDRLIAPEGVVLWAFASSDHRFAITMGGPCRITKHREGELNLAFAMDGRAIYKIAFSLAPISLFTATDSKKATSNQLILYVGQVQGTPHGYEDIRTATNICYASSPRDLLMNALFGVADAWGLEWIGGVSSSRQLTTGPEWSERPLSFQYDVWWEAFEAERTLEGHYLINLPERDSRPHRRATSRTRHKKRFKHALRTAIAQSVLDGGADAENGRS